MRSMIAIPKTMPPIVRMVGSSIATGLKGTNEYAVNGRGFVEGLEGDLWKKFRKSNHCVFLMLVPTFILFIFLSFMSQLFQLNTSGRPLRLFGSAPLQIL